MLVVAATAFAFNFTNKKSLKTLLLTISVIGLIVFCYMGYMRQSAETIFAVFPLLAVGITPILGKVVDNKGKAASMLMFGSILLIVCHLTFAFILPLFKDSAIGGVLIAYVTILILGASFSLDVYKRQSYTCFTVDAELETGDTERKSREGFIYCAY